MNSTASAAASDKPEVSTALFPGTNVFSLGADLLGQVQRMIGTDRVRALRIKLGSRVVKEIPVGPMTAVATMGLVLLAIIVSTMSIEVEHEPAVGAASEAAL